MDGKIVSILSITYSYWVEALSLGFWATIHDFWATIHFPHNGDPSNKAQGGSFPTPPRAKWGVFINN